MSRKQWLILGAMLIVNSLVLCILGAYVFQTMQRASTLPTLIPTSPPPSATQIPTWTPTATAEAQPTATPRATRTPVPTRTPLATFTPSPT
ncbi:MAG TPA: hypothetical protein ENN19_13620, partial [Chloroflexi bacterium]|nr:hypothetical protein [Chloroflexota bacterium]